MEIVIIGAGGHGRIVLDILREAAEHSVAGFIDANPALWGTCVDGVKVLGDIALLPKLAERNIGGAIVAIGDNLVRMTYARKVLSAGLKLVNAIHPSAVISATAALGCNIVVAAGAIICTGASVGDSTIINSGAVVDHECVIEEAVHLAPGVKLAGRVTVETAAFVGLGACVLPCLKVGTRAIVGAGAVVIRDVPPGAKMVGVPARAINAGPNDVSVLSRILIRPAV